MSTTSAVGKGEAERGLMGAAARAEGRGSVSVACIPDSRTYSRKQDPVFQTPPHSPTGPKRDVGGRSPTEKRGLSVDGPVPVFPDRYGTLEWRSVEKANRQQTAEGILERRKEPKGPKPNQTELTEGKKEERPRSLCLPLSAV